jgi:YbgC/YbaW family acyl-CoA thioester hydrolase
MEAKKFSHFTTLHKVRPDDIDMFNHVHNSKYLDYVLAARYEQMDIFYGLPMEYFLGLGYGWVVKTANLNFKRSLGLSDTFSVTTGLLEMKQKGCTIKFEIKNCKTDKICTDGIIDFVMIDIKSGGSVFLTDEMKEKYSI